MCVLFICLVGLNSNCSNLDTNIASWGYWDWSAIPPVSKYKFLVPRHNVNICSRWQRDHSWDLIYTWFNGIGFKIGNRYGEFILHLVIEIIKL